MWYTVIDKTVYFCEHSLQLYLSVATKCILTLDVLQTVWIVSINIIITCVSLHRHLSTVYFAEHSSQITDECSLQQCLPQVSHWSFTFLSRLRGQTWHRSCPPGMDTQPIGLTTSNPRSSNAFFAPFCIALGFWILLVCSGKTKLLLSWDRNLCFLLVLPLYQSSFCSIQMT